MKPITKISLVCSCVFVVALIMLIMEKYDSIIPQKPEQVEETEENDKNTSLNIAETNSQGGIDNYLKQL